MKDMKNFNNLRIKSIAKRTARSTVVKSAGISYHMSISNKTLGQKLKIQERKRCFEENMLLQHKEAVSSGGQMQNVKIYDCCLIY